MSLQKKGGLIILMLLLSVVFSSIVIAIEEDPTCSFEYMEINEVEYPFTSSPLYLRDSGQFYINGEAEAGAERTIENVQYNRTSPHQYYTHSWENAIPDGEFDERVEKWKSDKDDSWYVEGWHTICCEATDNHKITGDVNCERICIDKRAPSKVIGITHTNPSECVSNYISESPEFSWDEATYTGCAGIDYYEIEVYYSNGSLYYEITTDGTTITIDHPRNGEDYYIKVRAIDKAGNIGPWSDKSTDVYYDTKNPTVEITSPDADTWITGDFNVSEVDTDNLGLWKCYYRIWNDDDFTMDWTEITCNSDVLVDVSEYCPEDGRNNCRVYKKAVDNACNEEETHKQFDTDNLPPETTKTVSNPKIAGPNLLYPLVEWFILPETTISFDCSDAASGCNATYYRINVGNWTKYIGPFSIGEEDGVYTLEYYSVDNVGLEEEITLEIDKIDIIEPETSMIIEPPFDALRLIQGVYMLMDFISGDTPIALPAEDSEVGLNETWWTLLIPNETGNHYEAYIDGQFYEEWEEEYQECKYGDDLEVDDERDWMEECNVTRWQPKSWYMDEFCDTELDVGLDNMYWCLYEEPITIKQECDHKLCYRSIDHLRNTEETECKVLSVDVDAPSIEILNPSEDERDIQKCVQSIVAVVEDSKSGIKNVWAELYKSVPYKVLDVELELIKEVELELADYGTNDTIYEALMNKELEAGNYVLIVKAEDNVGNIGEVEISETLLEGIFVEYIADPICSIDPEVGGACNFEYHVCVRNATSIKMWMDKLGGIVTPAMMDAEISKGGNSAYVALWDEGLEAELLVLGEEPINGRTSFNLALNIPSDVASMIGVGSHKLDYLIETYL